MALIKKIKTSTWMFECQPKHFSAHYKASFLLLYSPHNFSFWANKEENKIPRDMKKSETTLRWQFSGKFLCLSFKTRIGIFMEDNEMQIWFIYLSVSDWMTRATIRKTKATKGKVKFNLHSRDCGGQWRAAGD